MIPFSVLDLSPIIEGGDVRGALENTRALAQHAESLGYNRFWVAEHHNMPGIASAATSLVIQHAAAATRTIRVGAGGIMLPNHAPLVIAEQFGTLDALFPGRIDLGLGRAPGTDRSTMQALRRAYQGEGDHFPRNVLELMAFLGPEEPGQRVRAVPGQGSNVNVWILGSSTYGAQLAAMLGLPYAFASHFAPQQMKEAIAIYRARFKPSEFLAKPYIMMGFNIIAAESDEEAQFLSTSVQQAIVRLRRNAAAKLSPPREDLSFTPEESAMITSFLAGAAIGSHETVRQKTADFIAATGADELIISAQIYDFEKRKRSFKIAADVRDEIGALRAAS
ncbi:MAG: LLM class flavin-dependent oxidoreductase [Hyphomonadaceae bacterium]